MFSSKKLGKFARGVFLLARTLLTNLNSIPFPQHDPPIHKHLLGSLTFGYEREYFQEARTMAPFSLTHTSSNTTSALTTLHPESNGYFLFFFENYELNHDLTFFFNSFKLAFQRMPHLSASGHFGMVLEHLWDCLHLENLPSGFL